MLGVNTIDFFLKNLQEIEFCSQRREMLWFLTTNIASVTSRANQQYERVGKSFIQVFDVAR